MTAVNRTIFKAISLVLLAAFITVFAVSMALANRDADIYPSNTAVGGISVANLNHEEARAKLDADIAENWGSTLQLKIDDSNAVYTIPLAELKITHDIDASLKKANQIINQNTGLASSLQHALIRGTDLNIAPVLMMNDKRLLYNRLAELKKKLDKPAADARVLYTQGYLEYVEHKNGYTIDLGASLGRIESEIQKGRLGPITLVTKNLYPKVKIEDIKSITDLIGVSVTSLLPAQKAELNGLQAALNGTVVMPGDQFSWQKAAGETYNNLASLPLATEVMVNACRSAQLNISNADPGQFTFSNDLGKPVMVSMVMEQNDLVVKIFGCQTDAAKEISLIKEQSVISPEVTVEVDKKLKTGQREVIPGYDGKIIRTYRVVKINGVKTEKNLLSEEVVPPVDTIMKVSPDTVIK